LLKINSIDISYEDTTKISPHLLKILVNIYYNFQTQRLQTQYRIRASKKNHSLTEDELSKYGLTAFFENVKNSETDIQKLIVQHLKHYAIYNQYLARITGIGPILAAGLISYIDDIKKYKHASSLWQYAGYGGNSFCANCKKPTFIEKKFSTGKKVKQLHPFLKCPVCNNITEFIIQKKIPGYQINWNPRLKQVAWLVGRSFVLFPPERSKYKKLYIQTKEKERRKNPKHTLNHIDNIAMRKTVRIFLVHLWQTWRRQEGLEATEPYTNQLLNHSTVEAFIDD